MKVFAAVLLSLTISSFAFAQAQSFRPAEAPQSTPKAAAPDAAAAAPADTSGIDPAKEADIRRLLELSGAKSMMSATMNGMMKNLKPMLMNSFPPGDYREKLIDLFLDKFSVRANAEIPKLADGAIAVYDRYFSDDDIKGLIAFYQTPVGQKLVATAPKIAVEMQVEGQKVGEQIGRETMLQVLSEHPEFQKAMEDARTGANPAK